MWPQGKWQVLLLLAILINLQSTVQSHGGPFQLPRVHQIIQQGRDYGDPLFLTPYLEQGMAEKARTLSEVHLPGTTINSYSGYLTVNKTYSSNMFFWFFPALSDPESAPLLLFLQGGPGTSSMLGLFSEMGPFYVTKDAQLMMRKVTWVSQYSMLFIDNPVGTGFSFTESDAGYARNQTDVADNLYNALLQFFQIYSQYQKNDFYVTGESYAGKYVPALSYKIHMENPTAKFKINFKGMAIGDGLCDPLTQYAKLPEFLYHIGLADESQRLRIGVFVDIFGAQIVEEDFVGAFKTFETMLLGNMSYFYNITGSNDHYNYLRSEEPALKGYYMDYLSLPEVRKAIHVGNLTFHNGSDVQRYLLAPDFLKSVKPWVATIMESYKVLIYNGQLDIIVGAPLTENFLWSLPWSRLEQYQTADRTVWKINPSDTEVAGFVKQVDNFYQVIVKGAGHILPFDQPERAYDMIDRFVSGRGFQ
ncbi:probable serine carboxypeptidase CPVL [Branchiostoma floridae]|uniref:Carboxypeptidase n=1 Tax=Branchiostoma floridae TaxID=7739 RepID=A0A9J7N4B3_BRAFL|nr:probable serine carboxypeptidase CPVL [Branchiostoma floridae]XP_035688951.1 probable serine carboxypeptidase CPVL [Branchiostoma floridae]